jgi:hypothetical protein
MNDTDKNTALLAKVFRYIWNSEFTLREPTQEFEGLSMILQGYLDH